MQAAARKRGSKGKGVVRRALLTMGISLLVVAGGSGTASAAPAYATPVTVGAKAVVTNTDGDPIRIREGAGTEYGRIAWAREGDVVSVLDGPVSGDGIDWFKIRATSATGWMMAQFLRGAEPAASAPAAAPAAARLTGQVRVANTDGDRLRVRSAPNTGGGVIGYLNPDATGTVEDGPVTDSAGIVWYRISAGGLRGWCMAVYLAQAQEEASRTAVAPASAPARAEPAGPTAATNSSARPTHAQLRQWMEEARALHPYPDSVDKMWRVMMCESSGNPNAVGAGRYYGLFQYLPGTWGGSWNPYRSESIFDARAQIFATARAWSIGMQGHWSCY